MRLKTIIIYTCMAVMPCVAAHAGGTSVVRQTDAATPVCAIDTFVNATERKRKRMAAAFGGAVTDTVAEGGIDFNPFTKEYLSKRHNPYAYTMSENKQKEIKRLGGDTIYQRRTPWYQKLYMSAFSGANFFANQDVFYIDPAVVIGGQIGYTFNKLHSIRISGDFKHFISSKLEESIWNIDLGLDYLFNLTNYMYGVNAKRWFDFSPVMGVGVGYSYSTTRLRRWTPHVRMGLNIDRRLSGNSHIYIEPYVICADDNVDKYRSGTNPRRYNVLYGFHAGVRVDFAPDRERQRLYMPDFNPHVFIDMTVGPNFYMGNNQWTKSTTQSVGSNNQLMFGRWFDPLLGMRIGFNSNDFYWRTQTTMPLEYGNQQVQGEKTTHFRGGLIAGRFELLFRPMNLFPRWREMTHNFELDMSLGFEVGRYHKAYVPNYGFFTRFYVGYTAGIDFLYRIAPDTWLMFGPRAVLANYTVPNANFGREGNYQDKLASINFGIRIQRPSKADLINMFEKEFKPGFEIGAELGTIKHVTKSKAVVHHRTNWLTSIYGAYNFTTYHAAMLELEYDQIKQQLETSYDVTSGKNTIRYTGMMTRTLRLGQVKAAYRLNITNLFMMDGHDRRRFNLYGYAGPAFSIHFNNKSELDDEVLLGGSSPSIIDLKMGGKYCVSGFFGFIASLYLNNHLAIYARPETQYFFRDEFLDIHRRSWILKMNVGLSYTF